MFSSPGGVADAADYLSFPKLLAAGIEHMLLQLFSLPVTAEIMFCMDTQQAHSKNMTAAHRALVCSLFSPWVSVSELVFTESKPVLSREAERLGLVWLGVRGLRCPFCWAGTAGT